MNEERQSNKKVGRKPKEKKNLKGQKKVNTRKDIILLICVYVFVYF